MNGLRVASSMGSSQRFSPSMPRMPHDLTSAFCFLLLRTLWISSRISATAFRLGVGLGEVAARPTAVKMASSSRALAASPCGLFDLPSTSCFFRSMR